MYNSNTDLLGLILDVEVFFSLGHCSGALCPDMGLNMYAGGPLLISGFLRTTGRPQQTMQNRLWLREERGLY